MAMPHLNQLRQDGDGDLEGGFSTEIQPDRRLDPGQIVVRKACGRQGLDARGHPSATAHHAQIAQGLSAQALHRRHVEPTADAHQHYTGGGGEIQAQQVLDRVTIAHDGGHAAVPFGGGTAGIINQRDLKACATGQLAQRLRNQRRPKAIRSATPAVTGGRTSGKSVMVSISHFPGNCRRDRRYARGVPMAMDTSRVAAVVIHVTQSASKTTGLVMLGQNAGSIMARHTSAASGIRMNSTSSVVGTAQNRPASSRRPRPRARALIRGNDCSRITYSISASSHQPHGTTSGSGCPWSSHYILETRKPWRARIACPTGESAYAMKARAPASLMAPLTAAIG
jgi:hypothetical protein